MSRGLEALHHPRIKSAKVDISSEGKHDIAYMLFDYTKQYAIIEKELTALDIVKNKIPLAIFVLIKVAFEEKELTKEEFGLLKEVLL